MIKAIIILGMHRSGTSCLTGCLHDLGLNLGSVSQSNKYNLKGNQENLNVNKLNESILKYNHGSWFEPPENLIYTQKHKDIRDQILSTYNEIEPPWAIKDPRILLLYEFWSLKLPKHTFIATYRHPIAVANSLAAREKLYISFNDGIKLWIIYNQKLLNLYRRFHFPVISFDYERSLYQDKIRQIAKQLGLSSDKPIHFFENKLITQRQYSLKECPESCRHLYSKLLEISV